MQSIGELASKEQCVQNLIKIKVCCDIPEQVHLCCTVGPLWTSVTSGSALSFTGGKRSAAEGAAQCLRRSVMGVRVVAQDGCHLLHRVQQAALQMDTTLFHLE